MDTIDRRLVLIRHAKSDWPDGVPDRDRPLGQRGRQEAPQAGRWLAASGIVPDLAVVSSARRAQQTWNLASAQLPGDVAVQVSDEYYGATVDDAIELARALPPSAATVALVGHNPTTEGLATTLDDGSGVRADSDRMVAKYPTSAIAVFHLQVPQWSDLAPSTARLVAFAIPR